MWNRNDKIWKKKVILLKTLLITEKMYDISSTWKKFWWFMYKNINTQNGIIWSIVCCKELVNCIYYYLLGVKRFSLLIYWLLLKCIRKITDCVELKECGFQGYGFQTMIFFYETMFVIMNPCLWWNPLQCKLTTDYVSISFNHGL